MMSTAAAYHGARYHGGACSWETHGLRQAPLDSRQRWFEPAPESMATPFRQSFTLLLAWESPLLADTVEKLGK
jgi:hypothetical protein